MRLEDMPFDGDVTTMPDKETLKAMEALLAELESKGDGEHVLPAAKPVRKARTFGEVIHAQQAQ